MTKYILGLGFLLFNQLAYADVYFCNFSHRPDSQASYRHKFSDLVFKKYEGTLHDNSGDLQVSIHYSFARNLVTHQLSDEKIHATFSNPENGKLLAKKSVDQGKYLRVQSMNNWLISCTSIIDMPY